MDFIRIKPKKTDFITSLSHTLKALVFEDFKSSGANLTGGIVYRFLRPILFTFLIALIIGMLRGSYTYLEAIKYLFINFSFFFFFLEFVSSSALLTRKMNLLNLPRVNFFSLIFSSPLKHLSIYVPELVFIFLLLWALEIQYDLYYLVGSFIFIVILGVIYNINMALILFRNNALIELHAFFQRALLFISAVFYSLDIIPEKFLWFFLINPLVHVMERVRFSMDYPGSEVYFSDSYLVWFILIGLLIFPLLYYFRIELLHYRRFK